MLLLLLFFLNGIAAWLQLKSAFRLVSPKPKTRSRPILAYSSTPNAFFVATRFVLSDVISVGQRIIWPASKAYTSNETEIHCSQKPCELPPKFKRSVADSTRLIRNPKWKQLIKVRQGQAAGRVRAQTKQLRTVHSMHIHTIHTHCTLTPRRPHAALSIRIRLV